MSAPVVFLLAVIVVVLTVFAGVRRAGRQRKAQLEQLERAERERAEDRARRRVVREQALPGYWRLPPSDVARSSAARNAKAFTSSRPAQSRASEDGGIPFATYAAMSAMNAGESSPSPSTFSGGGGSSGGGGASGSWSSDSSSGSSSSSSSSDSGSSSSGSSGGGD